MIIFPLNMAPFQALGPDGISMFFVSCVVSQLVYSLGGSAFKGEPTPAVDLTDHGPSR